MENQAGKVGQGLAKPLKQMEGVGARDSPKGVCEYKKEMWSCQNSSTNLSLVRAIKLSIMNISLNA